MHRRDFLRLFGLGTAAAATPALVERAAELLVPERRIWQVGRNAPVGGTIANANALMKRLYGSMAIETALDQHNPFARTQAGRLELAGEMERIGLIDGEQARALVGCGDLPSDLTYEVLAPNHAEHISAHAAALELEARRRHEVFARHMNDFSDEIGQHVLSHLRAFSANQEQAPTGEARG
jgi:hypothetical protein